MADPTILIPFTVQELETVRVALLSAHYSASDEERTLRALMDGSEAERQKVLAIDRADAALRAMRYSLLVERVMAATPPAGG